MLLILFAITSIFIHTSFADEDYYSLLGVDKTASKEEIKQAFKSMSLKYHPDKVPEAEKKDAELKFAAISNAYDVLSTDSKRKIYDAGGEEALKHYDNGNTDSDFYDDSDPFDIFDHIFTSFGHSSRSRMRKEDILIPVKLTLEEIFTGKQIDV